MTAEFPGRSGCNTGHRNARPYPDYVDSIDQEKHKWLANFLRLPDDDTEAQKIRDAGLPHTVDVFDVLNDGSFTHKSITMIYYLKWEYYPASPELFETLDNVPDGSVIRILIAQEWSELCSSHVGSHNAIGHKYNLHPSFLEMHFSLFEVHTIPEGSDTFDDHLPGRKYAPAITASEQRYLQIKGNRWGHLTATEVHSPDLKIFIILEADPKGPSAVKSVLEVLNSFSGPESIRTLSLLDLCSQYTRECLQGISREVFKDVWDCLGPPTDLSKDPQKILRRHDTYRLYHQCLLLSSESIRRYLSTRAQEIISVSETWKLILSDCKALMNDCERVAVDLRNRLQVVQTSNAIEEAKLGVRQAESVRRLTVVAFVFIPLSFATSFFGMNITQLKGDVDVKWFVLTAIISGLIAAVVAGFVKFATTKLSDALRGVRAKYVSRTDDPSAANASIIKILYDDLIGRYLYRKYSVARRSLANIEPEDTWIVIKPKLKAVPIIRIYPRVLWSVAADALQNLSQCLVPKFSRLKRHPTESAAV
ncbi:hypothetical protein ONS95_007055 [Cadophora gregata]|uniref:uncharacterized protein n=1 Tax=Cadophora gregata TaxID=51156 RepID=UPI0026DA8982|nr:uncharacterized protein ONS95_007055 [Cadophora gregata]KAK0100600.1 hypothetical protein ONS95_007055 [Cadophora gregata]KAK0117404.1 hypothetical protein ONS96_013234 [Cadophora gregata f. sp. sojae]